MRTQSRRQESPIEKWAKPPVLLGVAVAVLLLIGLYKWASWRHQESQGPTSGTVVIDQEKLRQHIRENGVGSR